jgi:predicted NBD/HSP70 family sugar kinase
LAERNRRPIGRRIPSEIDTVDGAIPAAIETRDRREAGTWMDRGRCVIRRTISRASAVGSHTKTTWISCVWDTDGMSDTCTRVGRGLLLFGPSLQAERGMTKAQFLDRVRVKDNTFRSAGEAIGSKEHEPGLRFFRVSDGAIAFGPGAGLVLGVSVGASSLRAAIVDANGKIWHEYDGPPCPGQLEAKPSVVLDRIREVAGTALADALEDEELLVEGMLPLLGAAVAWPEAVDRDSKPAGRVLANAEWHANQSLAQRVARHLQVEHRRSHALNDANAAALAVAFDRTCDRDHEHQKHPELTIVVRLAGGVGGATIIVEPPNLKNPLGVTSGFPRSVLIGGVGHLAGEIGHVSLCNCAIDAVNRNRPKGLDALKSDGCSCNGSDGAAASGHLEAYVSVGATTKRLAPGRERAEALQAILKTSEEDHVYTRALEDVGTLVGEALLGPVAWLNPARIVLTGSLATEAARRALDQRIADSHPIVTHPNIQLLDGADNNFVCVRGAALAVLRRHVHRELSAILGGPQKTLPERVKSLTKPYDRLPWCT